MQLKTPETLRQDVKPLLSGLDNPIDKEILASHLESIAMEDSNFYDMFYKDFKDLISKSGIKVT